MHLTIDKDKEIKRKKGDKIKMKKSALFAFIIVLTAFSAISCGNELRNQNQNLNLKQNQILILKLQLILNQHQNRLHQANQLKLQLYQLKSAQKLQKKLLRKKLQNLNNNRKSLKLRLLKRLNRLLMNNHKLNPPQLNRL